MTRKKTSVLAALLALALFLSACDLRYSQAPAATPTLIPTGLFVSPFPNSALSIDTVVAFGQETASAQTAAASSGTPGTPDAITSTVPAGTVITPQTGASLTPTVGFPVTVSATTPAPATVVPGVSTVTPSVVVPTISTARPASYTLQQGEWPFCVARRFNVNPDELATLNGLVDSQIVQPGLVLRIPQTGNPFPAARAWHSHPATFTVGVTADLSAYGTVYAVACWYGDVFPESIAKQNNIPLSATLTAGQLLSIP